MEPTSHSRRAALLDWTSLPLRIKGLMVVAIPLVPLLLTTMIVRGLIEAVPHAAIEPMARVLAATSIGAGLSAASALLATLLFVSGITRRVEIVAENADRLAHRQPLAPVRGGQDEIGRLAERLAEAAELLEREEEERRSAERAMRDYAAQVQDLYDSAPCGYHSLDAEGRFVAINQTELGWLGYRREEVVGRLAFDDVITEASRTKFADTFPLMRRTGAIRDVEFEMVTKDGRILPVSISASALYDESGAFKATRSSVFDIRQRKAVESALSQSRARLAVILQTLAEGLLIFSADGGVTYWNRAAERLLGLSADDISGKRLTPDAWEVYDLDGTALPFEAWPVAIALRTGREVRGRELRVRRGDGVEVTLSISVAPLLDGDVVTGAVASFEDATERHERSVALARAKAEAEQASRAKSEFLSRMSHDLRTPLNAMLGFAQLLDADVQGSAGRDEVRQILRGGEHLLRLINEVLDIARIEAGQLSLSPEPLALHDLIDQGLGLVRPLADRRQIAIRPAEVPAALHVRADRQRFQQVLLNLLSNAVKYNRDGGVVTVSAARASDRVRIEITDTGPGIRAEKMASLFRPFERLGAEQTGVEGTGLGLALSRGLIEAMGGAIGLDSIVDRGTTAWIELPEAEPLPQDVPETPAQSPLAVLDRAVVGEVLYIEDNIPNVRLMERLLERRPGVVLTTVAQGRLGVEQAVSRRPQLILLDLHLPDISGDEVLRRLWENPATRDIPVAVLSADALPAQVRRLREAGAVAYLTKPLDLAAVLGLVDSVLK